jgi:hypothetical protein
MSPLAALDHLLNFAAPALWLAAAAVLAGRMLLPAGRQLLGWPLRLVVDFLAGLAVLVAGLLLTGNDGQMTTWAVLAAVVATVEWVMGGGWRRK